MISLFLRGGWGWGWGGGVRFEEVKKVKRVLKEKYFVL